MRLSIGLVLVQVFGALWFGVHLAKVGFLIGLRTELDQATDLLPIGTAVPAFHKGSDKQSYLLHARQ